MTPLDRLSPSKINMFRDCPQRFAFSYVERLPEPDDALMVRGTLVHQVCERVFDLPARQRTLPMAAALLHRLWERMVDADPGLRTLFPTAEAAGAWIDSAERLLANWFRLETPAGLRVEGREVFVESATGDGVLAGVIDRLDRLPDGTWRITDYKTSSAPRPGWERGGFFQLRFYALVAARQLGLDVSVLRLVHLGADGEILELAFDPQSLDGTDRQVQALAMVMRRALDQGRWATRVGRHCDWCVFRPRCPAWADDVQTQADVAVS